VCKIENDCLKDARNCGLIEEETDFRNTPQERFMIVQATPTTQHHKIKKSKAIGSSWDGCG
jgi:hypothetical protein